MTPEDLYAVWAPQQVIWSQWVIPVPFAQMTCADLADHSTSAQGMAPSAIIEASNDLAVVMDLPGGDAIRFGLALARRGFRPVPIIDGSPGPFLAPVSSSVERREAQSRQIVVVDMSDLLGVLCAGGTLLQTISLPAHAPPAFLLDSMRMTGEQNTDKSLFDNRWKVFPQDFPSAKFLKQHGISRVLVVQKVVRQPQEDLAHVLLRWQEAGLEILVADEGNTRLANRIRVVKPFRFRDAWYRALEIFGLCRNSVGGFGAWPYRVASG